MKKVLTLVLTALFAFAVNASTVCHEDVDCSKVQGKDKLEKCDKSKLDNCGEKADKPCCSKHKLEGKKLDNLSSKPDTKKGDKKGGDKPERKDDGKLDPGKLDKPKK
ncbi:MAG: hypothetical protein J5784_04245 [Muribaculaceae bacterium]|nr:hypothetical protein [Muribaculaceae bacterium]MBR5436313.1 hypothetical protein [Muribaculaceae bacterium]